MELTPAQYETMIAYFEGRLSQQEELVFLEKMLDNPILQAEFDFELMIRAEAPENEETKAPNDHSNKVFDPAEEHIRKVIEDARRKQHNKPKKNIFYLILHNPVASSVIFLAILIICVSIIFLLRKPESQLLLTWDPAAIAPLAMDNKYPNLNSPDLIHGLKTNKDSNTRQRTNEIRPVETQRTQIAFSKFHKNYQPSDEDPPMVNQVLELIQQKKYKNAELKIRENDFVMRGGNEEEVKIKHYAQFYLGLCYLETGRGQKAEVVFAQLLKQVSLPPPLLLECKWFYAMSLLAQNKDKEARLVLQTISINKDFGSYKERASTILKWLNSQDD